MNCSTTESGCLFKTLLAIHSLPRQTKWMPLRSKIGRPDYAQSCTIDDAGISSRNAGGRSHNLASACLRPPPRICRVIINGGKNLIYRMVRTKGARQPSIWNCPLVVGRRATPKSELLPQTRCRHVCAIIVLSG